VPISFFFDDMPRALGGAGGQESGGGRSSVLAFAEQQEGFSDEPLNKRETLEVVRAYYRITDPGVRKRVFDLMKSLSTPEPN
jgi:hypothetical protein